MQPTPSCHLQSNRWAARSGKYHLLVEGELDCRVAQSAPSRAAEDRRAVCPRHGCLQPRPSAQAVRGGGMTLANSSAAAHATPEPPGSSETDCAAKSERTSA